MTQLQQFLFELSFGQTRKIREYMLKRYNVYCGSMKDLEQAINDYIPNTAKVTVKTGEIYFSFGVRFAESYELVKQENSNGE